MPKDWGKCVQYGPAKIKVNLPESYLCVTVGLWCNTPWGSPHIEE